MEVQLQTRPILPLAKVSTAMLDYLEPMDTDVASTSMDVEGSTVAEEDFPDYTVARYSFSDPRETDLEKELKEKMTREVDLVVKECIEWEKRILHLAWLAYLTPEELHVDYHMPGLHFPVLKREVQMMMK